MVEVAKKNEGVAGFKFCGHSFLVIWSSLTIPEMRSRDADRGTVLSGGSGESRHAANHDWELFVVGMVVTAFSQRIVPDQCIMQDYSITGSRPWQKGILTHHLDAEPAVCHQD